MTINREKYLNEVAKLVTTTLFKRADYDVPTNIRYSVSLPSKGGMNAKRTTIGQCWSTTVSDDNTFEILITPMIDDTRTVVATLIHEIVHATVGLKEGHKKVFKQCAVAVGLEGKMTATTLSDDTWNELKPDIDKLGDYPHAKMSVSNNPKKQTTRMIKAVCYTTDYKVRLSRTQIDMYGTPICPCCHETMTISL